MDSGGRGVPGGARRATTYVRPRMRGQGSCNIPADRYASRTGFPLRAPASSSSRPQASQSEAGARQEPRPTQNGVVPAFLCQLQPSNSIGLSLGRTPAERLSRECLYFASIAEHSAQTLQAVGAVEINLKRRRDRNCEHQPDGAPDSSPEHQGNGNCKRIQMNTRANDGRVHEIKCQQMNNA